MALSVRQGFPASWAEGRPAGARMMIRIGSSRHQDNDQDVTPAPDPAHFRFYRSKFRSLESKFRSLESKFRSLESKLRSLESKISRIGVV